MRIKSIDISSLKAPLLQTFRVASGEHALLDNLLIKLTLDNGIVGLGEAAVATHITGETLVGTADNLNIVAKSLVGYKIADYLRISNWLHDSFPQNKAVVAAVEMALLDALTQSMKIPLWRFFGNKASVLKTDITIVISSLQETQDKTKLFYKAGFRSFKIKIGRDKDLDINRVLAVSKLAPRSSIILDANQGYCAKEMVKFLKEISRLKIKIDLLEQPTSKNDIEGLKEVGLKTKITVCADESASSMGDVLTLIEKKSVGAINIKLMKTGLIHSFDIARIAKANGLKLMIGGMMESNLAMSASAHLASGLGFFDYIDLDTPFFIKDEVARHPFLSPKGVYDPSKVKSGIGIKVRSA